MPTKELEKEEERKKKLAASLSQNKDKSEPTAEVIQAPDSKAPYPHGEKANEKDLLSYHSQEYANKNRDYAWSPLVPEEYFAQRKEEEAALLKKKQKRERSQIQAAALADTLRLVGHGININRGAHETKWGPNEIVETGVKNLDRYTAEHAAAIAKIQDMELRAREGDRNHGYKMGRDEVADKRADIAADDGLKGKIDAARRGDEWKEKDLEYKEGVLDATAKQKAADRAARQRLYGGSGKTPPDNLVTGYDKKTGNEYGLDIGDVDHRTAIAHMAEQFRTNVANKDIVAKWQAEQGPEWKALNDMLNPNRSWSSAGIGAILPTIFNPEIAERFRVPISRKATQAPVTVKRGYIQDAAPSTTTQPQASVQTTSQQPYIPPANKVIQKAEEQRAAKEAAEQSNQPTVLSGRDLKRVTTEALRDGFGKISPEHRPAAMKEMLRVTSEKGKGPDGKFLPGQARALAKNILDYYYHAEPERAAAFESAAQRSGKDINEIMMMLVEKYGAGNISIDEIVKK